ncbi:MAG: hypothetical protein DRP01_01105 [Archaeoglobales archaeon]|nr:MAG: hypothetical protein DRP01_01105 [Archaeoglobales archaeon]
MREAEIDKLIRSKPNVLSWRDDLTKVKNGRDTGEPCITVFVARKVKASELRPDELIPPEIDGKKTDVVELAPEDFEIGETKVGKLPPSVQKRIAGGVKDFE